MRARADKVSCSDIECLSILKQRHNVTQLIHFNVSGEEPRTIRKLSGSQNSSITCLQTPQGGQKSSGFSGPVSSTTAIAVKPLAFLIWPYKATRSAQQVG